MPTIIYPTGYYHDGLRVMAWQAAGWAAKDRGETIEVWGPRSIALNVDAMICGMAGCLDAQL